MTTSALQRLETKRYGMNAKSSITHIFSPMPRLGDKSERGLDIARIHRLEKRWAKIEVLKWQGTLSCSSS